MAPSKLAAALTGLQRGRATLAETVTMPSIDPVSGKWMATAVSLQVHRPRDQSAITATHIGPEVCVHPGHVMGAFLEKNILGHAGARRNTTLIEETKYALDGPGAPLANDHGVCALRQVALLLCAFFDGKPPTSIAAGKIAAAVRTQCAEDKAEFGESHATHRTYRP